MQQNWNRWIARKLVVTASSTLMISFIMSLQYIRGDIGSGKAYALGEHFLSWTMIYSLYVGVIVFVYGNLVSVTVEWISNKWSALRHPASYIGLHSIMGAALAIVFPAWGAVFVGMCAALVYGAMDCWLLRGKGKTMLYVLLLPILVYVLTFAILQGISDEVPVRFGKLYMLLFLV